MGKQTYHSNLKYLKSFVGLTIISVIREEFYVNNELDNESMGTLLLSFSDGKSYTIDCDDDAESLLITCGIFSDKKLLENESQENKWIKKEFISQGKLKEIGKIKNVMIELTTMTYGILHTGCKLEFENGEYIYSWVYGSDSIFYRLNESPNYDLKTYKVELIKL